MENELNTELEMNATENELTATDIKDIERKIDLGETIEVWAADVAIGVPPADFYASLDSLLKREAKRIKREAVRRGRIAVCTTGSR